MIRLKSLELQGFRKFRELQHIDFPESGLLLLDGDSGAGKSSVMQAVAYALDICPFPATTLKSWSGEPLQVTLTVDNDGVPVVINRGKQTSIQFGEDKPNTGAKALEEGLRKLFGMAPELLSALTYRPQDTLGLFLSKDDAEKKEFLAQVLGLSSIESAIESSDASRKKLLGDLTYAQGVLAEREAALRKVLEGLTEVSPDPEDSGFATRCDAALGVLESVEKEALELDKKFAEAHAVFVQEAEVEKSAKREKLAMAQKLVKKAKETNAAANAELEEKRNELRLQITKTNQQLAELNRTRKDISEAQARLGSLEKNECYVCHKPFTAEAAIDDERDQLRYMQSQLEAEPTLRSRLEELSSKLRAMVPVVDPNESKLVKIVNTLETEIQWMGKTITDTRVVAVQDARDNKYRELARVKGDFSDAQSNLRDYTRTVEMKVRLRARQEETRKDAVRQVDDKRAEVAVLESKMNAERDFIHVLGKDGFLGAIFDEVLSEISREANETLGALPNTSHVSVSFRTETAKGKRAIVPVFSVGEYETTRQSGLSGGMGASADLAVDLGVAAVVERRLGKAPGWVCLDETFNGMPKTTKEIALETLQSYASGSDKLVIVIDHSTEAKAMFSKVLTVREEEGRSVVS